MLSNEKKIKVAMLSEYPMDLQELANGGVINAVYWLIDGLSKIEELDLIVITPVPNIKKRIITKVNNTTVVHFPYILKKTDHIFHYMGLTNLVKSLLNEYKPMLIHSQGKPEYIYSAMKNDITNIVTIHGILKNELPVDRVTKDLNTFFRVRGNLWAESKYISKINHLISITDHVVEFVQKQNSGVNSYRINNPISNDFFNVPDTSDDIKLVILFVAAVRHRKGLHILTEAVSHLNQKYSNIELRIVGRTDWDQTYVNEIKLKCSTLIEKKVIQFLGPINQEDLLKEYSTCSILCLPSFAESQPMVIIQAFAASKPVIASQVGGIPDMINSNANGLLTEPGNVQSVIDKLEELINNPEKRKKMGQNARKFAMENYSPESVAEKTFKVYQKVISQKY